jgi:DNA-binding TFAR19-related protein (PDSD5 family)
MTTVYDVPADVLIARLSDYMKGNIKELAPPEWTAFVKTGSHVERAPQDPDWWYVRAASMMRKLYTKGPIGVSRLRKAYGGRKRMGAKPAHFRKGRAPGEGSSAPRERASSTPCRGRSRGRWTGTTPISRSTKARRMSSDEELERIREQRMLELQAQQQQQEGLQRAQMEAEAKKEALMRQILTPEARQRLARVRMVRPDFAAQLELQLIQVAQSGRVALPINDDMLKRLLAQLQAQQSKRDIKITRR